MPIEHGICVASSFKGMTPEEIIVYVEGALNIPMRQVIGSDDILKASNEDKDGFEYQLKTDDKVYIETY